MEINKKRKRRRTKIELEDDIWTAVEKLIIKKGFHNLTVKEILQEAQVEPMIFYNRFENLDDMIEKYVHRYDYWLRDSIKIDSEVEPKSESKKLITNLINELYENEIMQKILLWELNDDSKVSRQMASAKETQSKALYQYFSEHLETIGGGSVKSVSSLIIAGIYYLVLHRKISTFGLINFDSLQGKQMLIEMAEKIINILFITKPATVSHHKPQTTEEVAKNMLDLGIEVKIIELSTGLTAGEINKLQK
jgi:AcrR family transcriptional regulator